MAQTAEHRRRVLQCGQGGRIVGLAACATWLLVAGLLRYSSLAALLALAAAPLYAWWFKSDLQLVEFAAILAAFVWLRHRANIVRLIKGQEPKIGGKGA